MEQGKTAFGMLSQRRSVIVRYHSPLRVSGQLRGFATISSSFPTWMKSPEQSGFSGYSFDKTDGGCSPEVHLWRSTESVVCLVLPRAMLDYSKFEKVAQEHDEEERVEKVVTSRILVFWQWDMT